MPKIRNKITGEIIEIPDQPGRVVASTPPMPKAPVGFTPGPNPTVIPSVVSGQAQIAGAEATARANANAAADKDVARYKAGLEANKPPEGFIWGQDGRTLVPIPGGPKDPKTANALDPQKLANLRAAQGQVDRLRYLFAKGPGATKGFSGLIDYLPTSANEQFDTAGAGLGEVGLAAFRVPGVGTSTDQDARQFVDANRPKASDYDAKIKEKFLNLQNRLNQTYAAYGIKRQAPPKAKSGVINFSDLPE